MSKTKIILLDVDGVLIKYPRNFTDELEAAGYKNAARIMQPYYAEDNNLLYNKGIKTEEELIGPYLERLGWKATVKDYLDAQCEFAKRHLDYKLMDEIHKIREGGIFCYTATNQGPHQARFLLENLDFCNFFDGNFISYQIGYKKNQHNFWEYVIRVLQQERNVIASPSDIVYFDDSKSNVEVASGFNIRSFFFVNNLQFEKDMEILGFDILSNKFSN